VRRWGKAREKSTSCSFLEEVEGHLRGDLHEVDGALH
jgi:hypothetical protein